MASGSARRDACALPAVRALAVLAAAGVAGDAGCRARAPRAERAPWEACAMFLQVGSQVRIRTGDASAPWASEAAGPPAAAVPPRMQYWKRWDPVRLAEGSAEEGSQRFLLFDMDLGGLNNLRIGWEVAATLAHETGRTLVLPPPKSVYLIDSGPEYVRYPEPGHKSRIEDFINMEQLQKGSLRALTVKEFADGQMGENTTETQAELFWVETARSKARSVHGNTSVLCDLSHWDAEDKFIYAHMVSDTDGRIFGCSKWWSLGTAQLKRDGEPWTPSLQAVSMLHGGFVWHQDVFNMASLIVQDLGMYKYASLHARYGDFQFEDSKEPAGAIISTWFTSDLGRRLMKNTTGVYVSTDDTSGRVVDAFRSKGIWAKSSLDYFDDPGSPVAHLVSQWGAMRVQQLKGPVEQVVCAFGRVFVGTGHSTFTGSATTLTRLRRPCSTTTCRRPSRPSCRWSLPPRSGTPGAARTRGRSPRQTRAPWSSTSRRRPRRRCCRRGTRPGGPVARAPASGCGASAAGPRSSWRPPCCGLPPRRGRAR
ncbi:unnamed protein product [Prorocentrum cordatum]|uniref:GDP-fucose protein O-fucosyltransferase 2 n=1 Tax=Prorocentrum cordatum TaxID=2364126 RepID=A0ABN9WWS8_9DINO|nr:unnamed protein product [Polarella glacialis]